MPRKGWSSLETPAGWYQVIRGLRPKAAPGQQWRSSSSWWQHGGQWPVAKSEKSQVQRRWQRGQGTRGTNPDEVLAAARTKVQRLERAIEALGDSESAEARWLTSALVEARRAAQERPTAIQVEERQAYIQRSRYRLLRMEQERVVEQKELSAAVARLTRLREEISRVLAPGPTQPATTTGLPDLTLAELHQLRARVVDMEVESSGRSAEDPCPSLHPTCLGRHSKVLHCSRIQRETDLP